MSDKRLLVALAIQLAALALFLVEFVGTVFDVPLFAVSWQMHEVIELASILGLATGSGLTLAVLRRSARRNARVEEQLKLASASFHSVLLAKFQQWGLSPAERETALLIVKGFSIAEIAELRGKSAGTIKAQNSAIYQKSGLSGRVQFVSYFLELLTEEL